MTSVQGDTPAVEVRLLGPFRVLVGGRELTERDWSRQKARQLFKCLLTQPHRRLLREEAMDLL